MPYLHVISVAVMLIGVFPLSNTAVLPLDHFSSKTAYNWTSSFTALPHLQDDQLYALSVQGVTSCPAVHVTSVVRHGARYPGLGDIEDISEVHDKLLDAMKPDLKPELRQWVNRFPKNNDRELTTFGKEEQRNLGTRVATKLKTLLSAEDMSDLKIVVSSKKRAKQSADAFLKGFSSVVGQNISASWPDMEVNNTLMRFYDLCKKYIDTVDDNDTSRHEFNTFLNGPEVTEIKNKMAHSFQLSGDVLEVEDVLLVYKICGYETATFGSSPWCQLLDEDALEVLEYAGDLDHFNKNGYAHDITWQQACPLVSDMFSVMDHVIVEKNAGKSDYVVGQFAFGHAETVGPLVASLGLFKDSEPLRADNFARQTNRKFRSSEILPFSSNVMFVLYECMPDDKSKSEYFLKLFVNEVETLIPGCQTLHCPYDTVRERYQSQIDDCQFDKLCGNVAEGGQKHGPGSGASSIHFWRNIWAEF